MGILFLIYYCVTVYSAKSDEKTEKPFDVGNLGNENGEEFDKSVEVTSEISMVTEVKYKCCYMRYNKRQLIS